MHKAIDGAFGRRLDVDQAVMRANFKMLAAVFIRKRATKHTEAANPRGKRNRPGHFGPGPPDGIDDLGRRTVEALVIKSPQFNAYER